jgi:homocysteine S-methyltransferase
MRPAIRSVLPVSAQPNAGLPRRVAGRRFEYNIDGAYFARYARRLVDAGATLVGGCCGTTPAQIEACAKEVSGLLAARARAHVEAGPAGPEPPVKLSGQKGLAERLAAGEFVVAAMIATPLGGAADEAAEQAGALRARHRRVLHRITAEPEGTAQLYRSGLLAAAACRRRDDRDGDHLG